MLVWILVMNEQNFPRQPDAMLAVKDEPVKIKPIGAFYDPVPLADCGKQVRIS